MKDDPQVEGRAIPERSAELAREAEQMAQKADELAQEAAELAREISESQPGAGTATVSGAAGVAVGSDTGTGTYHYPAIDNTRVEYGDMAELPGENTLKPPWSVSGDKTEDTNNGADADQSAR